MTGGGSTGWELLEGPYTGQLAEDYDFDGACFGSTELSHRPAGGGRGSAAPRPLPDHDGARRAGDRQPRGRLQRRDPRAARAVADRARRQDRRPARQPTAPARPRPCGPSPGCSTCTTARSPRARSRSTAQRINGKDAADIVKQRHQAGDGGPPGLRRADRRREPRRRRLHQPGQGGRRRRVRPGDGRCSPGSPERRKQVAGYLSGGEQQMLAIGRALMTDPKLLILDEPSLGLAPLLVQQIRDIIVDINEQGTSVLLIEQNATMALSIADHGLHHGDRQGRHGRAGRQAAQGRGRQGVLPRAARRRRGRARKSFRDVKHYKRRKRWLS